MPKSKESAFARAERLQKESLRLRRRGQYNAIVQGLKQHPEFIGKIYEHLESMFSSVGLSLVLADGAIAEEAQEAASQRKLWGITKASKFVKDEVADDGKGTENGSNVESSSVAGMVGKGKRLESHTCDQLIDLLAKIEPVCFSKAALNGLKSGKQRRPSKESLLQVWMFVTDLGGDCEVDLTDPDQLAELVEVAGELNAASGRRGLQLPLPPDWQNDGVFKLKPMQPEAPVVIEMRGGGGASARSRRTSWRGRM